MYSSPNKKVNIFYDAEFTGLHRNTTLISVGMVTEYGSTFYAEFNDYDRTQVDEWIKEFVIDNLVFGDKPVETFYQEKFNPFAHSRSVQLQGSTATIKAELLKWLNGVSDITDGRQIQFVSDCYAYDWVLLNDLICEGGQARNIPKHIFYIPIDLASMFLIQNIDPDISREGFCPPDELKKILDTDMFMMPVDTAKHNSLWDAYVIKTCYDKLTTGLNVFAG